MPAPRSASLLWIAGTAPMTSQTLPRLDELYRMVAYIYGDKLTSRSSTATFAHLAEVCGMLTIHDRNKKREGVDVTDALCKALGWYFPLLAKFRVRSAEALIFRKFPLCCPYCREAPHNETKCKLVKGTASTVNHPELSRLFREGWNSRPATLNEWQLMFQNIYPRQLSDRGRSTVGLLEELGELAEAVRVGESHPKYFLGEAADIFSYLMGIANEHAIRLEQEKDITFSFQDEFIKRYPGLCTQCGYGICICPSIPAATIGRMAKEIEIGPDEQPFLTEMETFGHEGRTIANRVLELQGGYNGLSEQLALDRGNANHSLVLLCNGIADAIEDNSPTLANSLRAEAFKLGTTARAAGTQREPLDLGQLQKNLANAWAKLTKEQKNELTSSEGEFVGNFANILDSMRVLFVHCAPQDAENIRVAGELRIARQVAERGPRSIIVEDLPSATINDLRTKLLRTARPFDVVHFAGHANADTLIFENENGQSSPVPLDAISDLLGRDKTKCVVLNACDSLQKMNVSISEFTIGVGDTVDDEEGLEFSRGFYDALSAGKTYEQAFDEGTMAVKLKGGMPDKFKLLKR
jgi:NTP pyrophosphatase (non-canonical NTP hydrolase)